jgi:RNA polymerase sigma factor (sigma-70 family)
VQTARLRWSDPLDDGGALGHDAESLDADASADDADAATAALDGSGAVAAGHTAARAGGPALDDAALSVLIGRVAQRDARALETLYEASSMRVYGFVQRFMRRHALTEEVVEDTFWQVWRQAPRFDEQRGRAMTWLFAMARSRAIDALRREQRFQSEPSANPDDGSAMETLADERALDLLEATRGAAQLHAAVAELEPRARQLLALAFFRGMTHEEIALHAGMPLGSVKSAIRRALMQLRARLLPPAAVTATPK